MGFILSLGSYGDDLLPSDSHLVEYLQNEPLSLSVRNTRVSPETTEIIEKLLSPLDVWHLYCWLSAQMGQIVNGENRLIELSLFIFRPRCHALTKQSRLDRPVSSV